MSGGSGSTLPVRTPITRPVSFHSLSDHNRNNQSHLSPYSHRRPRQPRSSPLAGPSLSSDHIDGENKDEGGSQKPRYRPNRISSTPDMATRTQSLYDPDTSSALSNGSIGIVVSPPPVPTSSSSSSSDEDDKGKESRGGKEEAEDGSRLRTFTKRLSMLSTSSVTTNETDKESQKAKKRRSGFILHSTSTTSLASTSSSRTGRTDKTNQAAPPIPTIPRWALNAMREEAGIANRNMKYGHRRGTSHDLNASSSLPPLPNQPFPRGLPHSASSQSRTPSVSRDPSENWMSLTDPTPKFSRLGLKGDAVVLPVKKKESLAKMKSSPSIKGTSKRTATVSQPTGADRRSGSIESSPRTDPSNKNTITTADANRKEDGLRKRSSSVGSFMAKIPRISVSSSTDSEIVSSIPSSSSSASTNQSGSGSNLGALIPAANDSTSLKPPKMTAFPTMPDTPTAKGTTTLRRDSLLAVIDENQPPPSLSHNPEIGTRSVDDVKLQDPQKTRARRKSIKQIVMRITTAPIVAGEKLKFGAIHNSNAPSTPVVVLPPLDPPPPTLFRKSASSSVPSLPSTKVNSDRGDAGGANGKRFKGIRKRWNAVFGHS